MTENKKRFSFLKLSAVIILLGILTLVVSSCTSQDNGNKNVGVQTSARADQAFNVDISTFTGNATFLGMLLQVKPQYIDKDYNRQFTVVDGATYIAKLNSDFDPSVLKKILSHIDQASLQTAIDSIKGQTTTPGKVYSLIITVVTDKTAAGLIAPTLSLASGAGTNLQFGNVIAAEVGYASPDSGLPHPEKTGRGYANALPARKFLDASDCYYLKEIKAILQAGNTKQPAPFFGAIMDVLTQCKVANISKLDDQVRPSVGDFLAVYFAEADRSAMYNLQKYSWQKDLLQATCLASYVTSAGGDPGKFWAMGQAGSGIGETRTARQKLAAQVCNAEKTINPSVYNALQTLIGTPKNGDLMQQLAEYLNNPDNSAAILANADKISTAATNFMVAIHDDAQKIMAAGVPKDIVNTNGCNQ